VDIGRLDVAILPATPARLPPRGSRWAGPGGAETRGGVLIAGRPVDRYVVEHPEFLLESPPEEARLDADNLHVLLAHLKAATFELPFEPGERFGPGEAEPLLAFLARRAWYGARRRSLYWSNENFPASSVSLRPPPGERGHHRHHAGPAAVIGEIDIFAAQTPGPRRRDYMHESISTTSTG